MKKILAFTIILILMFFASAVSGHAASLTPEPETSKAAINEKLNEQINQLKEKIASRVSELNLVEKRGLIGTVSEVSGSKITVKDIQGNVRFVDVDEITKFSSPSNKTFGLSDITKDTRISILGLYNKQSKRLLARFLNTSVDPIFVSGTISSIDTKEFFISVTTAENKQIRLENQTGTKIFSYDKENGVVKSGFSKLEVGARITAIGFPGKNDPKILVLNRIIDLSSLSNNPKIVVSEKEASKSGKTR